MPTRYIIIFGIVICSVLAISCCDQKTPESTISRESEDVYDNKGRLIETHRDGYVTTYKYEANDPRIVTSTETVRE